jgi:hypothetical protein
MANVNIRMHHPEGFPDLALPESAVGATSLGANTRVTEGDNVAWTGLENEGPMAVEFLHGKSPLRNGQRTVARGVSVEVVARKGLFPYDVVAGGKTFPNGGALEVEPR